MKLTFDWTVEHEENELEVKVSGWYNPGDPGCVSGPADNWVQPEPAYVEIESVLDPAGNELVDHLSEGQVDALIKKAESVAEEQFGPDNEYEPEYEKEID